MSKDALGSLDQEKLIDLLAKQLSELELFQTMYTPREIAITNSEVLEDIQNFISKITNLTPNHLDYTITQKVDNMKLEISVHLPSTYPEISPEIYVRCNQLNRQEEKSLNTDLTAYLQSKHDGEVCIFTAILWLQDNVENYINKTPTVVLNEVSETQQNFCRYWIYSHHIYSKKKTEGITKASKELHLTGFCLLGKPGVICIEGNEADCKEFWKIIKSWQWQKITLRIVENFDPNEKVNKMKFKHFEILHFPLSTGDNSKSFQKYMYSYGLIEKMNELFGVPFS